MRPVALVAVKRERGGGRWVYRVPFYESTGQWWCAVGARRRFQPEN